MVCAFDMPNEGRSVDRLDHKVPVNRVNTFRTIREPNSQIEPGSFGFRGHTGFLSRGGRYEARRRVRRPIRRACASLRRYRPQPRFKVCVRAARDGQPVLREGREGPRALVTRPQMASVSAAWVAVESSGCGSAPVDAHGAAPRLEPERSRRGCSPAPATAITRSRVSAAASSWRSRVSPAPRATWPSGRTPTPPAALGRPRPQVTATTSSSTATAGSASPSTRAAPPTEPISSSSRTRH
jgi:hypothetical protein